MTFHNELFENKNYTTIIVVYLSFLRLYGYSWPYLYLQCTILDLVQHATHHTTPNV